MNDLLKKKNIFNLLLLGIMVLAVPLTVKLARQQQILFSHAAETKIEFLTRENGGTTYNKPDGTVASCVTTRNNQTISLCPKVKVRFVAPTGNDIRFQAGSPSQGGTTSLLPQTGLVSKAYATACDNPNGGGPECWDGQSCWVIRDNDDGDVCNSECYGQVAGECGNPSGGGDGGGGGDSGGGGDQCSPHSDDNGNGTYTEYFCDGRGPEVKCFNGGDPNNNCGSGGGSGGEDADCAGGRDSAYRDDLCKVCGYRWNNCTGSPDWDDCGASECDGSGGSSSGGVESCDGYDQIFEDGTTHFCTPGEKGSDGQCYYDANGDGAGPANNCDKIVACPSGQSLEGNECKTNAGSGGSTTPGIGKACIYSQGNKCYNGNCLDGSQNCGIDDNCGYVNGSSGTEVTCSGGAPAAGGTAGNVGVGGTCQRVLHQCQKSDGTGGAYWCTDVGGATCSNSAQKGCWVKDTYGASGDSKIAGCVVTSGNFTGQAGTGGCCSSDTDCKASNKYGESSDSNIDNKSTSGMKCIKNNSSCQGSGNNACYPQTASPICDPSAVACGQTVTPTNKVGKCDAKGTKCTTGTCNATTGKCEGPAVECKCPADSTVTCGGTIKPSNSPCTGSCDGKGTKCSISGQTCGTNGTCSVGGGKFKCNTNKTCTADLSGTYSDKASCDAACSDSSTKKTCYICDGSKRVAVGSTLYTADECSGLTFVKAGAKPSLDSSQSICGSGGGPGQGAVGDVTFVNYRFAEIRTELVNAVPKPYSMQDGSYEDINFATSTTEDKFIWVQFQDDQGRWTEPKNGKIFFAGQDPIITGASCGLKISDQSLMFRVLGNNFGNKSQSAKITANGTTLETSCANTICDWTDSSIVAKMSNPQDATKGKVYQITLTRSDGVQVSQSCTVDTTQISLGARLFCRAPSSNDQDNVKLLIAQNVLGVGGTGAVGNSFLVGDKQKETVTITKDGTITPKTKLQEGVDYKVCILAPKSLRICTNSFTAIEGNNVIQKLELPLCDVNGDEICNTADASVCKAEWGPGRLGNKLCEFNKDGVTNSFEWTCLLHDFNKSSEKEP